MYERSTVEKIADFLSVVSLGFAALVAAASFFLLLAILIGIVFGGCG